MNNMHNQPFDPYYMGVDPTMYGAAGSMQMTPVMPYPGTPMLPGPVTRGPVAPASHTYNLNDPYNRFPPPSMPFFANNSPYTSSVGMHDYEEEGEGSGMHKSTPSLGGPSQPMGHSASRSQSEDGEKSDDKTDGEAAQGDDSPKKKPRVTLARGGACVNCRNRKLKCTGERPCKSCKKGSIECRYEELTRRRPRAVLMEERVVELEQLLFRSGIPVPPSPLNPPGANISPQALLTPQYSPAGTSFGDRPASSHSSSQTSFTLPVPMSVGTNLTINITPNSSLELSLINVVLPYTPYISIPLHAPRFLSLLSLPAGHPSRPHPALLYILFAEAVRIIEGNVPLPQSRSLPPGLFGLAQTPVIACAHVDRTQLLNQFHGTSLSLLERAQHELNEGIRNVDRPFDLVRAALGISRYLYTLGRFIEGWNIPVARLAITCGLHRLTGTIVSPDASTATLVAHPILDAAPLPYGTTEYYSQRQRILSSSQPSQRVLRKKPVILPPARDAIDVAERNATWWAVKGMDWSASVGWGWVGALSDADCTSELPWGWGIPVEKLQAAGTGRYSISDLIDTSSALHTRTLPESTYALSIASLCLLQKASSLFDRPSKGETSFSPVSAEFASECANLEQAVANLRKRIPAPFKYPSQTMALPGNPHDLGSPIYDGNSDPWWIQLHVSLFTSEMLLLSEMSSHRAGSYEKAVASARSVVSLVRQIRPDQWAHIEMITVICLSLVSRFLNNESARLAAIGQQTPAGLAADDAETLRVILERDISPWLQMAGLHALIITRVKKGWAEKEGEYERV